MRRTDIGSLPRLVIAGCAVVGAMVFCGCSAAGADAVARRAATQPLPWADPQPCDLADTDSLRYLTDPALIAQPFVFERVDCSGTTATAYPMPDGVNPTVAVRFEYTLGCWRPIATISLPRGRTDENPRPTMGS